MKRFKLRDKARLVAFSKHVTLTPEDQQIYINSEVVVVKMDPYSPVSKRIRDYTIKPLGANITLYVDDWQLEPINNIEVGDWNIIAEITGWNPSPPLVLDK